jgi:hypothetical protein
MPGKIMAGMRDVHGLGGGMRIVWAAAVSSANSACRVLRAQGGRVHEPRNASCSDTHTQTITHAKYDRKN